MAERRGLLGSRIGITLGAAALALIMTGAATGVSAAPGDGREDGSFLALGDSVVFGFIDQAGYAYTNPDNFVGYPDYVGGGLHLDTTNAACPGETAGSFIDGTSLDNGCQTFRGLAPLHTLYFHSQLDFATRFLGTHRDTRLVTISLGVNELFLLQAACGGNPACIQAGLPTLFATIGANMNGILGRLRATGFRGVLMVVNFYSPDYTDPLATGIIAGLNQVLAAAGGANGAVIADAFTAFQRASARIAGGQTCKAGLLNAGSPNQFVCDVHPSQSGHQLIAATVQAAYRSAIHGQR